MASPKVCFFFVFKGKLLSVRDRLPSGSLVGKESACSAGDPGLIPGLGRFPEKGISILAWRIPWTEEPGGLQSMGLQESD